MPNPRCLLPLACCSVLLIACVFSNPEWDPPGISDLSETGDELSSGAEGGRVDLPSEDESSTDDGPSGDGDPSSEDDDDEGDGDGDGDGDGVGDGDGDDGICASVAPSFGPCPASCDECHEGVCWRTCGAGECHDEFLVCPVSWSCGLRCIGKDSCKNATLACAGWGSCDIECVGENACNSADIYCAAGPCEVTCGGAADLKPCEHLDVKCGGDLTELRCEEPFVGAGPVLSENKFNECGCTTDCEQAN